MQADEAAAATSSRHTGSLQEACLEVEFSYRVGVANAHAAAHNCDLLQHSCHFWKQHDQQCNVCQSACADQVHLLPPAAVSTGFLSFSFKYADC